MELPPAIKTVGNRFFAHLIAYIFVHQAMCGFVGDDVHGVPFHLYSPVTRTVTISEIQPVLKGIAQPEMPEDTMKVEPSRTSLP